MRELVSDMTTEAFIAALPRFVSRRGKCTDLYSDNGKNFVEENKELRRLLNLSGKNKAIYKILANDVRWHFNPPLKRILVKSILAFVEMATTLTQIELIFNSNSKICVLLIQDVCS